MNTICRTFRLVTTLILTVASLSSAQVASSGVTVTETTPASIGVSAPPTDPAERLVSVLEQQSIQSTSRSAAVFIVPARPMTAEELADITEDVNVMRRIFENKLRQANLLAPAGPFSLFAWDAYPYFGRGGGDAAPSMYLQGYGVLFMMNVDYPLAPGPQVEPNETAQQPQAETDPVWARTRDEIYRPASLEPRRGADDARPTFSAERVENLKTTVIQALVHAANIRCLAPDESVVVRLTGSPESTVSAGETLAASRSVQIAVPNSARYLRILEGPFPETARTALTIRAKGADIKARADGKLTDEQFRQRVQVLSQPVVGAAAMNPAPPAAGTTITTGERITR